MSRVNIFFADGLEEIEGLTVVDLLRRAGIDISIISIMNGLEVTGSHNIKITADKMIGDVDFDEGDMIVLPGGLAGTEKLGACATLKEQIIKYNREGKMIAAICAAPSILGDIGVLEAKSATCYPGFESRLTGAAKRNSNVVKSQNIITSKGMGTSFDFALCIIEHYMGKGKARNLSNTIQYSHYQ